MTVKTLEKSLNWINFNTSSFYDVDFYVISKLNFIFNFSAAEKKASIKKVEFNEADFRWAMNEDKMANDKLAEGIRKFAADAVTLENMIKKRLS